MKRFACFLALMPTSTALGTETQTYSYDALGRLTSSIVAGGPSDGVGTDIAYDPLGNRSNYTVTLPGTPGCTFYVADQDASDEFSSWLYVSKSGTCTASTVISYSMQNGTAIAGTHYNAYSGTLTFSSTDTQKGVWITPKYNSVTSDYLTYYLNISLVSGQGAVSDAQGAITLWND